MKHLFLLLLSIVTLVTSNSSLYDQKAIDINGLEVDFNVFKGKVLLIVNVASECGFTDSHYKDLQRIVDILGHDDHFQVLGFPCNQFGGQEPGDEAAIDEFVRTTYNIDFPMFGKVNVIGDDAASLWKYIVQVSQVQPEWNFYKYLFSHDGKILGAYPSRFSVNDAFNDIQKAVKVAQKASKEAPKVVRKDLKEEL